MKRLLRRLGLIRPRITGVPYRFDLKACCPELAPALATTVQWRRRTEYQPEGITASGFSCTAGAHKWHHYFAIYDHLFAGFRHGPISLLEIGVYKGASLKVWRQYFHPESSIVGIDTNPECAVFESVNDNVHIRIGPQQDQDFVAGIVSEFGPFDLIIDDGSHMSSHMIASFNHLFDPGLKDGGLYFVEDTHTNFWRDYRDSNRSFMDFSFGLVECMHAHYAATSSELTFRVGGAENHSSVEVPRITTLIEEIRFFDSVVAIRKALSRELPQSQHW